MNDPKRPSALFIVNPISGGGKSLKALSLIERFGKVSDIDVVIAKTSKAGEGSEIARKALSEGYDRIIAVGGDGTVNEIGKELIGKDVPLGIIPSGSGNGLARHLKIPMNFKKATKLALQGIAKQIDTGTLNGIPFLNVCGIGMDAHVCFSFAQSASRGWFNYAKLILKVSKNLPRLNVEIQYEGKTERIEASMITIANSGQYGNNAIIAPKADISDGLLDVCIMKPVGFFGALNFYTKIMRGNIKTGKDFVTFPIKSISISGTDKKAHIDGDPIYTESSIEITNIPKSLNIITPV